MKETTNYQNIHELVKTTFVSHPEQTGYRYLNDRGETVSISWETFYRQTRAVARSLIKLGIKKGDKISIASFTNYEWVIVDMGTLYIGACTTGIYHSLLKDDFEYLINHSESKIVFVENISQLEKLLAIREKIPRVQQVVLLKGANKETDRKWVLSLDEFLALGDDIPEKHLDKAILEVMPSDLASLVYTSGTSGVPKGVMITHDNLIFTSQNVMNSTPVLERDQTLYFLPLAHIFGRVGIYAFIISNVVINFSRSIETVIDDLQTVKPHWLPSVPRLFEKIYIRIKDGVEKKGRLTKALFNWAFHTGYARSEYIIARKKLPWFLKLKYSLATKLVFKKIHNALGGRIRFCVSGAAPLNPTVNRFFHAAGIVIFEGYGMTENTTYTNINRMDCFRFGSVGHPAQGVEQKIATDGEILFKGRNIMKGYYKMPEETQQTLTKEGWLLTGDLGYVDDDGFLFITGRKKELIITSGGKNISPARIENFLLTSKYINQVCIVGDKRNYLTALITLNQDTVTALTKEEGITYNDFDDLNQNSKIRQYIQNEVDSTNSKLASFETIKKFSLVPEFTIDNNFMTPTLKIKKSNISKEYHKEIEALYE